MTQEQVEAWMERNNFDGSIQAARTAIADARTMDPPVQVLIEVQGGVAECTVCPPGVEVKIVDHDNEKHQ